MSASGFRGRLFGPGLAGAGVEALGQWQGERLLLRVENGSFEVAAPDLRIEASGFNLRQLRLSWQAMTGEFAFFIEQDEEHRRFLAEAPATIRNRAGGAGKMRRRAETRFRAAFVAYGVILALPLIILLVFLLKIDRVAEWAADMVPPAYEEKIGDMVLAQTRVTTRLVESGPAVEAVRTIGAKLTADSRYAYRWFVAEAPEVNAFAAPGGVIVIYSGLLALADSPEQLAGVLAHEVAHVEQRHSLKNLIKSTGFSVLLAIVIGDWSGSAIGGWAANLTELKFSRDAETEADTEGLRRLVNAGIAPHAMADFFGKLAEKEGGSSALSILATHPPSEERMKLLRQKIAALPPRHYQPLDIDWGKVQAALPD